MIASSTDPSPLAISVALRGGRGMDIFWNYTRWEARDDILATIGPGNATFSRKFELQR